MKPNKITIQAFGPYDGLIEVDFDVFDNKGMFLITGPTGAGKTMIFDAIVYAMYGQTSGSLRQVDQLRCDHALDEVASYVELEFSIANKRYTVKRTPKYRISNRKTDKQPTAILSMPNGKMVEGVKEVTAKIEDLLNIDAMQFKQIAMIAQGEFTKLIHASSEERSKVLRKLFSTYKYEMIEEQVRQIYRIHKEDYERLATSKKAILGQDIEVSVIKDTLCTYEVELKQVQACYEKQIIEKEQQQHVIQNIQNNNQLLQQYQRLKEKQRQFIDNQANYTNMATQITMLKKAKDILPIYNQVLDSNKQNNDIQNRIQKDAQILKDYKIEYENNNVKYSNIHCINDTIQKLLNNKTEFENTIKRYEQYQEINEQYQKELMKYNQVLKQEQNITNNIQSKEEAYQKDANKVATLVDLLQKEKTLENEYKDINQYKLKIHTLSDQFDKLHNIEEQSFICREEYMAVEAKYEQVNTFYLDTEKKYLHMQAGILASDLQANTPCPVCGSLEHPTPAKNAGEVDKAMVEKAQKKLKIATKNKEQKYSELIAKKTEVGVLEESLSRDALNLGLPQELTKQVFIQTLREVTKKELYIKKQYDSMSSEIQYLNKLKTTMQNTKKAIENLYQTQKECSINTKNIFVVMQQIKGKVSSYEDIQTVKIEDIHNQYIEIKNEIKRLQVEVETITSNYYNSQKQYQEYDIRLEELYQQEKNIIIQLQNKEIELHSMLDSMKLDKDIFLEVCKDIDKLSNLESIYQQYLIDKELNASQIETLEKQIQSITYQVVDIEEVKLEQLNLKVQEIDKQRTHLHGKIMSIKETLINVARIENELEVVEEKYIMYNDLLDMVTGKNEYKLSFERYVLAAYFENILLYANVLLAKMTQGRYQLYRRTNRAKGNAKQGLDLDVYDIESGMYRDVKTLSGGESFKASLALALGLSNMIQSHAGGIHLQTIFIDEGFGTLDNDSLDQAIACLMESQGSQKLIGLISHVSELKQRIDNKIIIQRKHRESSITIEVM